MRIGGTARGEARLSRLIREIGVAARGQREHPGWLGRELATTIKKSPDQEEIWLALSARAQAIRQQKKEVVPPEEAIILEAVKYVRSQPEFSRRRFLEMFVGGFGSRAVDATPVAGWLARKFFASGFESPLADEARRYFFRQVAEGLVFERLRRVTHENPSLSTPGTSFAYFFNEATLSYSTLLAQTDPRLNELITHVAGSVGQLMVLPPSLILKLSNYLQLKRVHGATPFPSESDGDGLLSLALNVNRLRREGLEIYQVLGQSTVSDLAAPYVRRAVGLAGSEESLFPVGKTPEDLMDEVERNLMTANDPADNPVSSDPPSNQKELKTPGESARKETPFPRFRRELAGFLFPHEREIAGIKNRTAAPAV